MFMVDSACSQSELLWFVRVARGKESRTMHQQYIHFSRHQFSAAKPQAGCQICSREITKRINYLVRTPKFLEITTLQF
jgi:hypothetical protein